MSLTQNQQDLVNFLKDGGMIAVQGLVVKSMFRAFPFRVQRNTVISLAERGLLAHHKHEDGWDYYVLKTDPVSQTYTKKEGES